MKTYQVFQQDAGPAGTYGMLFGKLGPFVRPVGPFEGFDSESDAKRWKDDFSALAESNGYKLDLFVKLEDGGM